MSAPIKPSAVLCRDGERFAVESVDGSLIVSTPSTDDPVRETLALAQFEFPVQPIVGVLRHGGVPIETVRAFIRLHGGFEAAGPLAMEVLRAVGQPLAPETAPAHEITEAVEEAASGRPFPGYPPRPASRIPPGTTYLVTPPESLLRRSRSTS